MKHSAVGLNAIFFFGLVGFLVMKSLSGSDRGAIPAKPFDAPPDAIRIVAMGTSLTARYDWPMAVTGTIAECLDRPVETTVVAKSGHTSHWGRAQIERVTLAKPDVVLIEFAVNDADLRHWMSVTKSRENHQEIITRVHAALPNARIILMGTNPISGLRAWLRPRYQIYLDTYATLAQNDPRIGWMDMSPLWRTRIDRDGREIILDGLHPDINVARAVITPSVTAVVTALWGQVCSHT